MMDLGPTGRTKHTEDHRPVSPTVSTVEELKRVRMARDLMGLTIICVVVGLSLWAGALALLHHMQAPERGRTIRACAVAMEHEEELRGPVVECEGLDASERQEAAYQYGHMRGLW